MLMNVEIPLDHRCSAEFKQKVTIISLKGLCCSVLTTVIVSKVASYKNIPLWLQATIFELWSVSVVVRAGLAIN